MKNTIPLLMLLTALAINPATATETDTKLQQLQQALTSKPDDAVLLNETGFALYAAGKYSEAEALFQKSLAILEKTLGKDDPAIATSLNNLAVLYRVQGKYEQAEPFYRRSLEIREQTLPADDPDLAQSLNNLAVLYYTQGKYKEAEPLYLKSLAIWEKVLGKDHPDVALSLNNLAGTYDAQGKYKEAEPLYLRGLAIREKSLGKNHPDVAQSLNNLAMFYKEQAKYNEAEPLYLRSLAIREQALGKDHPSVADSLNNLALLYKMQRRYDKAEPLYKRSLAIWEKTLGKDHPTVAISLDNLAMFYAVQGKYKQAEPLLARSLRLMNQSLERWLWGSGEQTRQSYLQQEDDTRNVYLSFYSLQNTPEEAFYFSLARKGLLLRISSEISSLAKQSSNPEIQKQTQEFNALKVQLANLAFSGAADKTQIQTLEEKSNLLEMQLSQKVAGFKRSKTEVTPKEVLAKLKPEQAVVDFLIYINSDFKTSQYTSAQVMALVADKKNGVKLIKLGELARIAQAIKTYRQNILPNEAGQLAKRAEILNPVSQKLYQLIWQPLLPYLAHKKEVFVIPDGILHLLPFKALMDKQGHYLAENQQITLLSSARDIVLPPIAGKTNDSVIFAAPAFGEQDDKTSNIATRSIATRLQDIYFSPLDGAAAEGQALSDLIKTKQPLQFFQGLQATETSVDAIKSPRLLHFATHGFFLENLPQTSTTHSRTGFMQQSATQAPQTVENPLTRSGLALTGANLGIRGKKQLDGTDGILTALEVLALNLEGTDLVTLSACETGVGDIQVGEGVYSLNRAFQEAGAKSVLSTLWSVADEQTKLFMQDFYAQVLNGTSPQQALQKTQLKFIQDKNTQDPFFWAAFTMVGI